MKYLPTVPSGRIRNGLPAALVVLALTGLLLIPRADAASAGSQADRGQAVSLKWFDVSKETIAAAGYPQPITSTRAWAVSWVAAARAVRDGSAPRFQKAAFATALHDTLLAQVPSREAQLDAALASTLDEIPDGPQKSRGIAAGEEEAETILAEREGDGLDTASVEAPWTPPAPAPGIWQPTPPSFGPAVRAGQKDGDSFLLASNDQFRPGPPACIATTASIDIGM